jgi:hypothetical protein
VRHLAVEALDEVGRVRVTDGAHPTDLAHLARGPCHSRA